MRGGIEKTAFAAKASSLTERSLSREITRAIGEALEAQPFRVTYHGNGDERSFLPTPITRGVLACLDTFSLPGMFAKDGRLRRTPGAKPAGETHKLSATIIAASRVARAGAHVIVMPDIAKPVEDPRGTVAVQRLPQHFRTYEAAKWSVVDIDNEGEAPQIALPVLSAEIDWKSADVKTVGVHFDIPRSARTRVDPDELAEWIIGPLTIGLARAADEILLAKLVSMATAPYTLAKAAAAGLHFDELRAIVGTNAAGAAVSPEGSLHVQGVPAVLTGDMTGTLVGAFDRTAVAIQSEVNILFKRLTADGRLEVTAWATMLPLVPDASRIWIPA